MANDGSTPRQGRGTGVATPREQRPDGSLRQLEETDRDQRAGPCNRVQPAARKPCRCPLSAGPPQPDGAPQCWTTGSDPALNPTATAISERSRATFAHVAFHQPRVGTPPTTGGRRGRKDTPKLAAFTVLLNLNGTTDVKEHRWTRCSSSW